MRIPPSTVTSLVLSIGLGLHYLPPSASAFSGGGAPSDAAAGTIRRPSSPTSTTAGVTALGLTPGAGAGPTAAGVGVGGDVLPGTTDGRAGTAVAAADGAKGGAQRQQQRARQQIGNVFTTTDTSRWAVLHEDETETVGDAGGEGRIPANIPKLSEIMAGSTKSDFVITEVRNKAPPSPIKVKTESVTAAASASENRGSMTRRMIPSRSGGNARAPSKKTSAPTRQKRARHLRPKPIRRTEPITGEPWMANFASSSGTQRRIQAAASKASSTAAPGLARAVNVLDTLLSTPPEWCNASNVVCALTLSARLVNQHQPHKDAGRRISRGRSSSQHQHQQKQQRSHNLHGEFRSLLSQTTDVLSNLVANDRLTARQLCNVAWAIGKLYSFDNTILPEPVSRELGRREEWDLSAVDDGDVVGGGGGGGKDGSSSNGDMATAEERLERTMDLIAARLVVLLASVDDGDDGDAAASGSPAKAVEVKPGELSMACWAYAVTRPRNVPPGWELPPRVGQLPGTTTTTTTEAASRRRAGAAPSSVLVGSRDGSSEGGGDIATFERWDDYSFPPGGPSAGGGAAAKAARVVRTTSPGRRGGGAGGAGTRTSGNERGRAERSYASKSDRITDGLFDAVANALCRDGVPSSSDEIGVSDSNPTTTPTPPPSPRATPPLLRQCPWKELATIAWAYATRGHYGSDASERLMARIAEEAARRLDNEAGNGAGEAEKDEEEAGKGGADADGGAMQFIPRDVAQISWAVGVLQSDNFRLGESLGKVVESISRYWLNDDRSDGGVLALSSDGNGNSDNSRLSSPQQQSRPFLKWDTADLVQLSVAMSHGRIDNVRLLSEIYNEALHIVKEEEDRTGVHSHVGRHDERRRSGRKRRELRSWELAIMLWVQARLYLTSKQGEVFAHFSEAAPRILLSRMQRLAVGGKEDSLSIDSIGLGAQEQATLAWSLTVLEQYHTPQSIAILRNIFRSASSSYVAESFIRLENAHQLWQALFLLEEDYPDAVRDVPDEFRRYLEGAWNAEKSRRKVSSARHRSLSQTLNLMGVAHYNEHDEDIDVAIILKDESSWTHTARKGGTQSCHHKVAVEFDGPNHFTMEIESGGKPRALGHTVLKYRLLKRQGWTVVRVPYYEYDKIPFWASMERQRYLQRLLKTHADIRFSDVDRSEYKPIVPNRQTRFD